MSEMGEEAEPGSQSGGGNVRCVLSSENYSIWTTWWGGGREWASQAGAGSPAYQTLSQLALGPLKRVGISLPPWIVMQISCVLMSSKNDGHQPKAAKK